MTTIIPEAALNQHIAILSTFENDKGPYWSALIGVPGRAYTATVTAICWRRYKSRKGARRAGMKALRKMFGGIEIREN